MNKIHPLFEEWLKRGCPVNSDGPWGNAGKPVVEEEPTKKHFVCEKHLMEATCFICQRNANAAEDDARDKHPIEGHDKAKCHTCKDARIKYLEEKLVAQSNASVALIEAGREIRNAALEEAAKAAETGGLRLQKMPGDPPHASPDIAARIRGLKRA